MDVMELDLTFKSPEQDAMIVMFGPDVIQAFDKAERIIATNPGILHDMWMDILKSREEILRWQASMTLCPSTVPQATPRISQPQPRQRPRSRPVSVQASTDAQALAAVLGKRKADDHDLQVVRNVRRAPAPHSVSLSPPSTPCHSNPHAVSASAAPPHPAPLLYRDHHTLENGWDKMQNTSMRIMCTGHTDEMYTVYDKQPLVVKETFEVRHYQCPWDSNCKTLVEGWKQGMEDHAATYHGLTARQYQRGGLKKWYNDMRAVMESTQRHVCTLCNWAIAKPKAVGSCADARAHLREVHGATRKQPPTDKMLARKPRALRSRIKPIS